MRNKTPTAVNQFVKHKLKFDIMSYISKRQSRETSQNSRDGTITNSIDDNFKPVLFSNDLVNKELRRFKLNKSFYK